jgi:hypothetical protein
MSAWDEFVVRRATAVDAPAAAQLLHDFNRDLAEPTPPVAELARRLHELIEAGDTIVLLGGEGPDGVAVLRLRQTNWTKGRECYLAEL